VAAAFEIGFEPDSYNLQRQIFGNEALTDGKDIGVIVLPRKPGRLFIPAKRTTHAVHFVRHHRFTVARAAEDNPTLALAARHRFRCRANEKRIIYGFFIKGAEVFYVVSERAEQLFYLFFVTKTGVVRAERNFHVMNLLPEMRGHCRGQPAFVIPSGSLALSEVEPALGISHSRFAMLTH